MENSSIMLPFFGVMTLSFVVWVYMYVLRLQYISANNIDANELATPEKLNALIPERINNPSNNLKNLFELPVLFYAVCLYLYQSNAVDPMYYYCAWAFFILRCAHSLVQCTSNVVAIRFSLYLLSSLVLWFMVLRCLWSLLTI